MNKSGRRPISMGMIELSNKETWVLPKEDAQSLSGNLGLLKVSGTFCGGRLDDSVAFLRHCSA